MRKYLPGSIAALIITIGAISGTALANGKHHPANEFATQDACVFNTGAPGEEAGPLLWGACDDVQLGVGGRTVTLVIEPEATP